MGGQICLKRKEDLCRTKKKGRSLFDEIFSEEACAHLSAFRAKGGATGEKRGTSEKKSKKGSMRLEGNGYSNSTKNGSS